MSNDQNLQPLHRQGASGERCRADFPCLMSIHDFAGLQPACEVCAPFVPQMRGIGWRPAGRFWLSDTISAFQSETLVSEIVQAQQEQNIPSEERIVVVPDPAGEFPACRPAAHSAECQRCGGSVLQCQGKACPASDPAERWTFRVRPPLRPCPQCGDDSAAQWIESYPENTPGSFGCDVCGYMAKRGETKTEAAEHWNAGLPEPEPQPDHSSHDV